MPRPPIPDVFVTVQDGALGILPPPSENVHLKIGVATRGDINAVTPVSTLQQAKELFGSGPLVESIAVALTIGGPPVFAIRGNASVAGVITAGPATKTGTGDIAAGGTPVDSYDLRIRITNSGGLGTARFQYTLDGGDTHSPEILVPSSGTYAVEDTGITLTFTEGPTGTPFVAGDEYRFTTTPPAMTAADLVAALDAALADPREWGFVHVVGTATPAVAAAVATKMAEAETRYRFAFAVLEARDVASNETPAQWMANLISEWSGFASTRVGVVAGFGEIISPISGRLHRRPLAWSYTGRLQRIPVHEHPGRVISGPVPGITLLYHDEQASTGLDSQGFTTFRTIIGYRGFYVTNGRIMAPPGSDFQFVELRRVMDLACRVARNAALRFLNEAVRIDAAGNILEADAQAIERYVEGQLEAALIVPGHASGVAARIDRASNLLATRTARITIRVRPLGYLSWIETDIGFVNPKLVVQAA